MRLTISYQKRAKSKHRKNYVMRKKINNEMKRAKDTREEKRRGIGRAAGPLSL